MQFIAQANDMVAAGSLQGLGGIFAALGSTGFAVWIGYYLITKTIPKQYAASNATIERITEKSAAVIESITQKCEDTAKEKDIRHEAVIRELTSSFVAELKLERAERKEELLSERERTHRTTNMLAEQSMKMSEQTVMVSRAIQEFTAVITTQNKLPSNGADNSRNNQ